MNDRSTKSSALFTPSGCLTGDALMLFVSGSLKGVELNSANQHITECPLCADAADGLRMWLKENKTDQGTISESHDKPDSDTAELSGEKPFPKVHPYKSSLKTDNKFHARTDVINQRIKQRLHSHSFIEAAESKRLSYKPFVWIAAAASVILFIGGFYVVWLQNQLDVTRLAEERASQMLMLQNPVNPDTLSILLPKNNGLIAMSTDKEKEPLNASQNITEVAVADEEVYNQYELSIASDAVELPEKKQMEEVVVTKEESKVLSADKAATAPVTKNAMSASKRAVIDYDSQAVFTIVEEMPSFPGGDIERNKFLAKNIVYPQQASENGIQGTVYVSFIVDTDGKIEDVKILRGIGGGCEEEALRVVKLMPRWKAGRQDGKTVRILYTMPIYFKLQ